VLRQKIFVSGMRHLLLFVLFWMVLEATLLFEKESLLSKRQPGKTAAKTAPGKTTTPAPAVPWDLPGELAVQWAKGQDPGSRKRRPASQALFYHGGPISSNMTVVPIFLGPSWTNPTFAADKIVGIEHFMTYINGSHYANIISQYMNGYTSPPWKTTNYHYLTPIVDTTVVLTSTTNANNINGLLQTFICAHYKSYGQQYGLGKLITIFSDVPRGNADWCAYHTWITCPGGPTFAYAFVFSMDNDPGCEIYPVTGAYSSYAYGRSQGLVNIANVFSHELTETITDADFEGWWDLQGNEICDKCAWDAGLVYMNDPAGPWILQAQWSNQVYNQRGASAGCVWTA